MGYFGLPVFDEMIRYSRFFFFYICIFFYYFVLNVVGTNFYIFTNDLFKIWKDTRISFNIFNRNKN